MDTLFPYTTLCRSPAAGSRKDFEIAREGAVVIDRPHSAPLLHEQLRAFHKARHLRRHISKVGLAIAEEVHPLRLGQAPDDRRAIRNRGLHLLAPVLAIEGGVEVVAIVLPLDRKSTRLNSSH